MASSPIWRSWNDPLRQCWMMDWNWLWRRYLRELSNPSILLASLTSIISFPPARHLFTSFSHHHNARYLRWEVGFGSIPFTERASKHTYFHTRHRSQYQSHPRNNQHLALELKISAISKKLNTYLAQNATSRPLQTHSTPTGRVLQHLVQTFQSFSISTFHISTQQGAISTSRPSHEHIALCFSNSSASRFRGFANILIASAHICIHITFLHSAFIHLLGSESAWYGNQAGILQGLDFSCLDSIMARLQKVRHLLARLLIAMITMAVFAHGEGFSRQGWINMEPREYIALLYPSGSLRDEDCDSWDLDVPIHPFQKY